jgi:AcrR family transcriptional regulator
MAAVVTGGRPPARERLTRERVLRAALEFTDAHGLAPLSMQKLGAELGVKGMSLYTHIDSKDALLDGIVEIMSAEVEMPPAAGPDWRDALRRLARSLREVIRRHPAAAPLLVSRNVMPTRRLEVIDAYLRVLRHAGFPAGRALDVLRTVYVYAQGYALAEVSFTDSAYARQPARPDDELARMRRVTQMVPPDAPDHLLRLAMQFCGQCDMDDQFDLGVDLMIRGLEAECPHPRQ